MKNTGGRPKKGEDAKNVKLTFYISKRELGVLQPLVQRSKLSMSNFIYTLFKKGVVNIYERAGLNQEQLKLIGYANNNLNQIARQVNTTKQTELDILSLRLLKSIDDKLGELFPNYDEDEEEINEGNSSNDKI